MGELIAVLSGKGGTGKTSLCAGIATALAQEGEDVLCIDCDVGLRNLDIALGMTDTGALSFADVYRGEYALSQASIHRNFPTLRFLTAPVNCQVENVDREAFSSLLQTARRSFSYIFLDAPAGIDAGFRLCASFADRVVLVTNSDLASMNIPLAAAFSQPLLRYSHKGAAAACVRIAKRLMGYHIPLAIR